MIRAPVNPALLTWARERVGLTKHALVRRFPKLDEWETGETQPTFNQTDAFASSVNVPVGYLFSSKPPIESIPLKDSRVVAGTSQGRPSVELLDVIRICTDRQTWFRHYACLEGRDTLPFVASATTRSSPSEIAHNMLDTFNFGLVPRQEFRSLSLSKHMLVSAADRNGILVMVSGIVGCNTHRRLDLDEFSGFTLSDPLAPLVFVNGLGTESQRMFALVHELAHIWLGSSSISECHTVHSRSISEEERWCSAVAAEFLDLIATSKEELHETPAQVLRHARMEKSGGGFYPTLLSRVGYQFARALVESTLEGQTLYRDAYRMLGIRRGSTFLELARRLTTTP